MAQPQSAFGLCFAFKQLSSFLLLSIRLMRIKVKLFAQMPRGILEGCMCFREGERFRSSFFPLFFAGNRRNYIIGEFKIQVVGA